MKYLVLYNTKKPTIPEWAAKRFEFDFEKRSFANAPRYIQDDGDDVIDAEWIFKGCDFPKYDGIIAVVSGDALKGVWGTHVPFKFGGKLFSVIEVEYHEGLYREPKGIPGTIKMVSTRKKTAYPQFDYTFNHELIHSYKYINGQQDLLHFNILMGRYDKYRDSIPEKPEGLTPRVARDINTFCRYAKWVGVPCIITAAYRSVEEQNGLYKQGRETSGPIVTNAKGGESFHNYGVAFDVMPLEGYNISDKKWRQLKTIGNLMGYEWGGDWKDFVDKPHFQLVYKYTIKDFQEGKIDWRRYN